MSRELVKALEALPKHGISGWEWECSTCHYHWDVAYSDLPENCDVCGHRMLDNGGQYVDDDGYPCDHGRLIDLDRALEVVRGNA